MRSVAVFPGHPQIVVFPWEADLLRASATEGCTWNLLPVT